MSIVKKYPSFVSIMISAIIAYIPIFLIQKPLWDDYTLTSSNFNELSLLFKDVGYYRIGIAHLHYFLNVLNGDSVFFSRLFSFVCMICLCVVFYFILVKLQLNTIQIYLLSFLFILLPFFGACFTQIVLPYIICFNLFLFSIICLINFILTNIIWAFVSFLIFVTISYITNSFIFFVIPATLLIWIILVNELKIKRKLVFIFCGIIGSIFFFMVFKHFLMQVDPNSIYENYNKITFKGLLMQGPQKTLFQIPKSIINIIYLAWDILKQKANLSLMILLIIPFYLTIKKFEWKVITLKYFLIGIAASILLIFSAIYPYAVVGKVNDNMYEYTSRFDMLLPVGVSILISLNILFFIKNQKIGKVAFSIVFSVLFVSKLCVFINFYYQTKLQNSFYQSYISKLDGKESYLIHEKKSHLVNWRFYEIGGFLRSHNAPENVFFIYDKSRFFKNDTINRNLVNKNVKVNHFALNNFDVDNFQYKPVEFVFKEKLDILDFLKLVIGIQSVNFEVKELPSKQS